VRNEPVTSIHGRPAGQQKKAELSSALPRATAEMAAIDGASKHGYHDGYQLIARIEQRVNNPVNKKSHLASIENPAAFGIRAQPTV
jgi:hypothetical protein